MPAPDSITAAQLSRLTGTPEAPIILDVRVVEDFDVDPRMLPASRRRDHRTVGTWADEYAGQSPPGCATPAQRRNGSTVVLKHGHRAVAC
jgi:hypothetical protein